jgi:polysaccharide biosynthesis protein PslH
MRIVVLASEIPYPPTFGGARLRQYEILSRIAKHHEVTVLCFLETPEDRDFVAGLEARVGPVHAMLRPPRIKGRKPFIYFQQPFQRKMYHEKMARLLAAQLSGGHVDVAHVTSGTMAVYANMFRGVPTLLDATDSISLSLWSRWRNGTMWKRRISALWWWNIIRRYESEWYPRFTRCTAVAEADAAAIQALCPRLPVAVVRNGVDTAYFSPNGNDTGQDDNALVFTGTMDFLPNIDAVAYFVRDILPIIRRSQPETTFSIVGRVPTEEVRELGLQAGVTVTGFVADLRPIVRNAAVYVCPMRQGTGMKNKLLEAMAMGSAIVTTSCGARGINVADGQEWLVRDRPQEFADAVLELMQDSARRRALGEAARQRVLREYGWEEAARLMVAQYELARDRSVNGVEL